MSARWTRCLQPLTVVVHGDHHHRPLKYHIGLIADFFRLQQYRLLNSMDSSINVHPPEFLVATLQPVVEDSSPRISLVPMYGSATIPALVSRDETRPYVTLTFAQSLDAKIAGKDGLQISLSGKESMVMTHWFVALIPARCVARTLNRCSRT